jgi:hypothetical protein
MTSPGILRGIAWQLQWLVDPVFRSLRLWNYGIAIPEKGFFRLIQPIKRMQLWRGALMDAS